MPTKNQRLESGYGYISVIITILAIFGLAWATLSYINPQKQQAKLHNQQRKNDVAAILNAVYQYQIDNAAQDTLQIPSQAIEICKHGAGSCEGLLNLNFLELDSRYLSKIPEDPTSATLNGSGYKISKSTDNHFTVFAPYAEENQTIQIYR